MSELSMRHVLVLIALCVAMPVSAQEVESSWLRWDSDRSGFTWGAVINVANQDPRPVAMTVTLVSNAGDVVAVQPVDEQVMATGRYEVGGPVTVDLPPSSLEVLHGVRVTIGGTGAGAPAAPSQPVTAPNTPAAAARGSFSAGTHLVGSDIASGRYFTDPTSGCGWSRLSGLGGETSDIIANDFQLEDQQQLIVDITPSDRAFETNAACGRWQSSPAHGMQTAVGPGTWMVGRQMPAGTYRANPSDSCGWARLRDFSGTTDGIIANDFTIEPQRQIVEIQASDAGFQSSGCGVWTRVQ